MSNVQIVEGTPNGARVDTFTRTEGVDTVHMQAVVPVDSVSGNPLDVATEATLVALKNAALAIQAAAEAISGKTTAVDTGNVQVANFPAVQAVTDSSTAFSQELADGILFHLASILEKMPRLDKNDRLNAMISDASGNELNSPYYGVSVNMVGEPSGGRQVSRMMEPWNFADTGAARLYQQIQVS